jgi:hypothetical protein
MFSVATLDCEGWEGYRAFVYVVTGFFAAIAFGIRPEQEVLEAGKSSAQLYVANSKIVNQLTSLCLWSILVLWMSLCAAHGMVIHVAHQDEMAANDGDHAKDWMYRVCSRVLAGLESFNKRLRVPAESMRVCNLYRVFYLILAISCVLTCGAALLSEIFGWRYMGLDKNWGMFFLLLTESLLPFCWTGSLLYTFSIFHHSVVMTRSEKVVLFTPSVACCMAVLYFSIQGKWAEAAIWCVVSVPTVVMALISRGSKKLIASTLDCRELKMHAANVGIAGVTALGPMILLSSQSVSCLIKDFSGMSSDEGDVLNYSGNCDSIFVSVKCLAFLFVFAIFQFCNFAPTKKVLNVERVVRLELSVSELTMLILCSASTFVALFMYSVGGAFGESSTTLMRSLAFLFNVFLFTGVVFQVGSAFFKKLLEDHGDVDLDVADGGGGGRKSDKRSKDKSLWDGGLKGVQMGARKARSETSQLELDNDEQMEGVSSNLGVIDVGFM